MLGEAEHGGGTPIKSSTREAEAGSGVQGQSQLFSGVRSRLG